MKRTMITLALLAVAGGAFAEDFAQQMSVNADGLKTAAMDNKTITAPGPVSFTGGPAPAWHFGGDNAWWNQEPGYTVRERIARLTSQFQLCESHILLCRGTLVIGGSMRTGLYNALRGVTTEPDFFLDGAIERLAANDMGLGYQLREIHRGALNSSTWVWHGFVQGESRHLLDHINHVCSSIGYTGWCQ
jgi:hypothetical protein